MASAPSATARRASSTSVMPFTTSGPSHCRRTHAMSSHVGGCAMMPAAACPAVSTASPPTGGALGKVSSRPARRKLSAHSGRSAISGA